MRIIAGEYGSRVIAMPKGVDMRPTQDKVREAIFNILGDISGRRVLEMFAGSGALGIEALSRGAGHVTFVDNNFRCIETIKANLASLGVPTGRYNIIKGDAVKICPKLAEQAEKFDIVIMDPPYYGELAKKCLINADAYDILSPVGLLMVEHFKKDLLPTDLKTLAFERDRRYGDTIITFFRKVYDKSKDCGLPRDI